MMAFSTTAAVLAQSTIHFTVVTNPPAAGNVSGGGIYETGTVVMTQILAANGWYIQEVGFTGTLFPPDPGYAGLNPAQLFSGQKLIAYSDDPTLFINFTATFKPSTDCTMTAWLAPLSPTISLQPSNRTVLSGSTLSLAAVATARLPLSYQWQQNGTNLPGQTSATLVFNPADETNSGTYTLVASNAFGVTNSLPATVTVRQLLVSVNGWFLADNAVTVSNAATVSLDTAFSGGLIFYTLDGSAPSFGSTYYAGPFVVSSSRTLRAIAYSSDFSQSFLLDPISLFVVPAFYVFDFTGGGGTVAYDPPGGPYPAHTVVAVTATPNPGWVFMGWSFHLSGTNPVQTMTMDSDKTIQAIFGTAFGTSVVGGGTITAVPQAATYPFGSQVSLYATPNPSNYFVLWAGAASGNQNPLTWYVSATNRIVTALFTPLPANQLSLVVKAEGGGTVTRSSYANSFPVGSTVTLSPWPNVGQSFSGWSGDADGSTNSLSVTLDRSKTIVAHFSDLPSFGLTTSYGQPFRLALSGALGSVYLIEATTNLTTWETAFTVTNFFNSSLIADPLAGVLPYRMYRAVGH